MTTERNFQEVNEDLVDTLRFLAELVAQDGVKVMIFPEVLDDAADAIEELRLLEEADDNQIQLAYEEITSLQNQIAMLRAENISLEAEISRLTYSR
jgi:hypothetical protein